MNKHGLFDIYGAVHVPFWQTKAFLYGIVGSMILLIGLLGFLFFKWRKKAQMPLWTAAFNSIDDLKKNNIAVASKGKEFYGSLTEILKKYLQDRYGFDSIGKTDEELIEYLNQQHFSTDLVEKLQGIFLGVTIIKFANAQAAQDQIDRDLEQSVQFIKRTIPSDKR